MLWQGQTSCWQFLGRVNLAVGMLRLEASLCAQNGVCTQLVVNMLGSWVWHLSGTKAAFAQNGICTQLVVNMLGSEKARNVVRSSRSISRRNNSHL